MEALFLLVGGAIFSAWSISKEIRNGRARLNGWTEAAASCHLTDVQSRPGMLFGVTALIGKSGSLTVTLEEYTISKHSSGTRIIVAGPIGNVTLRRETMATRLGKRLGNREIELGDERFDDTFYVGGEPARAFALLDFETRGQLLNLDGAGEFTLESGTVCLELPVDGDSLARELGAVLPLALHCARRLATRDDLADRLAENAKNDHCADVRLNNLALLLREFGDVPATSEALRALLRDPDPRVRLRAAAALGGPEGRAALLALLEADVDDACAAGAVAALGLELPIARVAEVLHRAHARGHDETIGACIAALGRSRDGAAVSPLARVLVPNDRSAPLAAEALGRIATPAAEQALVQALTPHDAALRSAAAQALGRFASIAAVLPLRETMDRFGDRAFHAAARQAIAEIQARTGGASPGQLSMAAADAGQLSIAGAAEAGRLSVADDEAGRVSLPEDERRED